MRKASLVLFVVLLTACTPSNTGPARARDLAFDAGGGLWVAGDRGVVRLDLERGTHKTYTRRNGLPSNSARAVAIAADGAVWVGTDGGTSRFDGKRWTTYTEADGLADDYVCDIAAAPDGTVWFGTDGGASRFDGQTWTTYRAGNTIDAVAVASDGAVWLDASRFDGETLTHYASEDGLPGDARGYDGVTALALAPDGAVWAGGYGGGVYRFDGRAWTTYRAAEEEAGPIWVEAIAVASDGALWVSTWGGGLIPEYLAGGGVSRFDGKDSKTYWTAGDLQANYVTAIAVAPDGAVWIGTQPKRGEQGGVARFDGQSWTSYTW